jgi:hypothetical protein
MNRSLGREIARQYLTRQYGNDRGFVGMTDHLFTYIDGGRVQTVLFRDVDAGIRTAAEAVVYIEHSAA